MRLTRAWRFLYSTILSASLVLSLSQAAPVEARRASAARGQGSAAADTRITTIAAAKVDRSPALRDLALSSASLTAQHTVVPLGRLPKQNIPQPPGAAQSTAPSVDQALQDALAVGSMPVPSIQFEGINNISGVAPPDTNGDIGPGYYVQWVNLSLEIWSIDRAAGTATPALGPLSGNALWHGFGGPCEIYNSGDPVVLYDGLADRWFLSQFAVAGSVNFQCIVVSATADPTGAWYRYAFDWGDKMNDYPKFGVWPDAYYMTANQFNGDAWGGQGVAAFERGQMLLGLPARMIKIDLMSVNNNFGGMLPADLDGSPPPQGTPGYFVEVDDSSFQLGPVDELRIWEFKVDWSSPAGSAFGQAASFGQPNQVLPVSDYNPLCLTTRDCIPQKGVSQKLDAIGDRLMFRLAYRYFPGDPPYESLVMNHTVNAGTSSSLRAGVRWYEVRKTGGAFSVAQQGTYAGDSPAVDLLNRWMGSIAMDWQGNMALGYSLSGTTSYPAVGYVGRLAGDPAGTLARSEQIVFTGPASQDGVNRWGDYSSMSVDPVDECTFWYTNEYSHGGWSWATRVAAFKMPECAPQPHGGIAGVVKDQSGDPVEGAMLAAGSYTQVTGADGRYAFPRLSPGAYPVTASMTGYEPQSVPGLSVSASETTTQDFTLVAFPPVQVRVSVFDGSGHPEMALYASVVVSSPMRPDRVMSTDPANGVIDMTLSQKTDYTLSVSAPGYYPATRAARFTASAGEIDFSLKIDPSQGCPTGYVEQTVLAEGFEEDGAFPPDGWSVYQLGASNGGFRLSYVSRNGRFSVYHEDTMVLGRIDDYLVLPAMLIQPNTFMTFSDYGIYTEMYGYHGIWVTAGEDASPKVSTYAEVQELPVPLERQWRTEYADLSAFTGQTIHAAFNYQGNWSDEWYIDSIRVFQCSALTGARVIGYVKDANTGLPVVGAEVAGAYGVTISSTTPGDPVLEDGFYQAFVPLDNPALSASAPGYAAVHETLAVDPQAATWHNFSLPAGRLSLDPVEVFASLEIDGAPTSQTIKLGNTGSGPLNFSVKEIDVDIPPVMPVDPTGPFAPAHRHVGPKNLDKPSLGGVVSYMGPVPGPLSPARSATWWNSHLPLPWGIGYNIDTNDLWLSDVTIAGGDNNDHRFTPDGINTGDVIDTSAWVGVFPADFAYDSRSKKFWQVNVGGDNCIYELDPAAKKSTGRRICPHFGTSQRGLAYDPVTRTFYSGSWSDGIISHFNMEGVLLDSVDVGLDISGLAYNPVSRHLFAVTNSPYNTDIFVLDAANLYQVLDSFEIAGLYMRSKTGLDIDCQGRLWLVSPYDALTNDVVTTEPIESTACSWQDIPWLSAAPVTGSLAPGDSQEVTLTIDPTGGDGGEHTAYLAIETDTPYRTQTVKVTVNFTGYGARLAPVSGEQAVVEGSTAIYQLNVINTGTVADTYHLSISGNAWDTTLSAVNVGPLQPGESAIVKVTVAVPRAPGTSDAVTVKMESQNKPGLVKTALLQTRADFATYMPTVGK